MAEPNMLIPLPDEMARLMKLTQWQAEQIERLRARVFALEDAQGGDAIPLAEPRTPEAQRTAEICISEWATARMEAMQAAIGALQREAYTWSKAAETYAKQAQRTPLDPVMTDRELLEAAANAAGIEFGAKRSTPLTDALYLGPSGGWWNPLTDDGDALRLALKLGLCIEPYPFYSLERHSVIVKQRTRGDQMREANPTEVVEVYGTDAAAATRRAIVRSAAAVSKTPNVGNEGLPKAVPLD